MLEYILSALDDAVLAYNIDKQEYMFVSTAVEKVTGYGAGYFKTGKYVLKEILIPEDKDRVLAELENLSVPGELELTFRIILPNKEIRWIYNKRVHIIHKETGEKIAISILRNVTEAVLYKNSAEQKVWFLSSLINSVGALVYRIDANGNYTYVNNVYCDRLGYSRAELIGKPVADISHPADVSALNNLIKQVLANPGEVYHFRHRKITATGDVRWIVTDSIAVKDQEGNVAEIQGVGLDVTEQENAKEQITWAKNNLEALINNTYDLIWSIDRNKRYVSVNKAFKNWIEHVYQKTPEEGILANDSRIYPGDVVTAWDTSYERALNGETFVMDYKEINPATNKLIYFEVAFNPIKLSGDGIVGVGCFAHDVTNQVLTREAILQQNDRLRNIASLSSHELRRPVASLMGLVDIFDRQNPGNPENKDIINHIQTVSLELDEVIRLIVNKTFIEE